MTDPPILLTRREGAVAEITLNRPRALNALSQALIAALGDSFREMSRDDGLRAIVLTGAGRAFCAGVDLKELSQGLGAMEKLAGQGGDGLADTIRACPHPVIAAVNGHAVTGGLELALMADFIIAGASATFADTHARVGITPSWGMTQILPRLIGINRARQMSLTGDFIDADTARAWGLANEVVADAELLPRARQLAARIAETDRSTMTAIRRLIARSRESPLAGGLAQEARAFEEHIAHVTPDDVAGNRARVTARGRAIAGKDRKDNT